MTAAATKFIDAIEVAWDHLDCWSKTAERGLSDSDAEALMALCAETGETDYAAAEAQVMATVRAKVQGAHTIPEHPLFTKRYQVVICGAVHSAHDDLNEAKAKADSLAAIRKERVAVVPASNATEAVYVAK